MKIALRIYAFVNLYTKEFKLFIYAKQPFYTSDPHYFDIY